MEDVRSCYKEALFKNPDLEGKLIISWIIDRDGNVQNPHKTSGTIENKDLENCIYGQMKTWNFTPPPAGTEQVVSYPYILKMSAR